MNALLAVDVGIRAGLAFYDADGQLQSYRSHNFGSRSRLRAGVRTILAENPELQVLLLEGGGTIADIWERAAERQDLEVIQVSAETWREALLLPREQKSGAQAKGVADGLARSVITWSAAPEPTSLRHDAAEAILAGLWGVDKLGWLSAQPADILRS
jgi:hypothetical protein